MDNTSIIAPIDQDPIVIARTPGKTTGLPAQELESYQVFGRLSYLLRDKDGNPPDMTGSEPLMCAFMNIINQQNTNSNCIQYQKALANFAVMVKLLYVNKEEKLVNTVYHKALNFQANSKSLKFSYAKRDVLMAMSGEYVNTNRCYFYKHKLITATIYSNVQVKNTFAFIINSITNATSRALKTGTNEAMQEIKFLYDSLA